jgi:hypothetical protein
MTNDDERTILARLLDDLGTKILGKAGMRQFYKDLRADKFGQPGEKNMAASHLIDLCARRRLADVGNVAAGEELNPNDIEGAALSFGHDLAYDMAKRVETGRMVEIKDAGASFLVVAATELKEQAEAGEKVFYQSIAMRPSFGEWIEHFEHTYFPPALPINDDFAFYINFFPAGQGTYENPSDGLVFFTVGLPSHYRSLAESTMQKHELYAKDEIAPMLLGGGDEITQSSFIGRNIFQIQGGYSGPVHIPGSTQ